MHEEPAASPQVASTQVQTPTVPEVATPASASVRARVGKGRAGLLTWPAWKLVLLVVATVQLTRVTVSLADRLEHLFVILLVSTVLACALEPAVAALSRRTGMNRHAATGVVLFGLLGVLAATVAAVGAAVAGQVSNLAKAVPQLVETAADLAGRVGVHIRSGEIMARLESWQQTAGQLASEHAADAASGAGSALVSVATGVFVIFYLVADAPKLRRSVCSVLPAAQQRAVLRGWEIAVDKAGGYLMSRAALAACSIVTSTVGFLLLDVPYALALGLWTGIVSQLIPIIGTYLAMALPALVALGVSPMSAVWVLVLLTAYQQVENFALAPWLTNKTMQVHPAVGLLAVFAGTSLLGTAGAVIALPVLATVQAVLSTYLHRHELVEDGLLTSAGEAPAGARSRPSLRASRRRPR